MRVEAVSGRRGVKRFGEVPKRLYPPSSPWVAPLDFERRRFFDPRKNAFFDHAELELFVAVDARGRDVGRVAAIENPRYNEFQKTALGFFGFFDAPDDPEVAQALLERACQWVAAKGHGRIHGPVHPSTNHECGLLVEGFELAPVVQMPYNHAYYEELLLAEGFAGVQDLVSFLYDVAEEPPERFSRALKVFERRGGFTLRPVNLKNFEAELAHIQRIYNEAWSENFGFVPLTDREIECLAHDLRPIIDPDLCVFAEVGGEVVGVMLFLPDYNQLLGPLRGRLLPFGWWRLLTGRGKIDGVRGMVMGIRPGFRNLGIDYACYHEAFQVCRRKGHHWMDISWILEDNAVITRAMERLGAHIYKRHRLYEKDLP